MPKGFESQSHRLPRLNLPLASVRLHKSNGSVSIFDPIRKKFVALTPEEWVRQNFVAWLQSEFKYPASLISNEIGIKVNDTQKRCDTVIFKPSGEPLIIVEYKAPQIKITQDVFEQIVRYNMKLKAEYLVVSNGMQHFCCKIDYSSKSYSFIPQLPYWNELGISQN